MVDLNIFEGEPNEALTAENRGETGQSAQRKVLRNGQRAPPPLVTVLGSALISHGRFRGTKETFFTISDAVRMANLNTFCFLTIITSQGCLCGSPPGSAAVQNCFYVYVRV